MVAKSRRRHFKKLEREKKFRITNNSFKFKSCAWSFSLCFHTDLILTRTKLLRVWKRDREGERRKPESKLAVKSAFVYVYLYVSQVKCC